MFGRDPLRSTTHLNKNLLTVKNLYIYICFIYKYLYRTYVIYISFKVHYRRCSEAISIFPLPRDTLLKWKIFTFPVPRGIGSVSKFFSPSAAWY